MNAIYKFFPKKTWKLKDLTLSIVLMWTRREGEANKRYEYICEHRMAFVASFMQRKELRFTEVLSEMIISLLKLSKQGPVSRELVKNDAKLPLRVIETLLQRLQNDGLVYVQEGSVRVSTFQRLGLAVCGLQRGVDYERVSGLLDWKEFESIAGMAFESNGYAVKTNVHFKQGGRRWELDIVACKKPLIVCADCKHWTRNLYPSKLRRAVEEQAERTLAFSGSWPNQAVTIDCVSWNDLRFVPMILLLTPTSVRFHDGTPIVAILQLRDFLAQLPMYVDSMKHFDRKHEQFKIAP